MSFFSSLPDFRIMTFDVRWVKKNRILSVEEMENIIWFNFMVSVRRKLEAKKYSGQGVSVGDTGHYWSTHALGGIFFNCSLLPPEIYIDPQ